MHLRIVSHLFIISSIAISVLSIKVPVDNPEAEATDILPIKVEEESPKTPVYYLPSDGTSDSFLIPPHQLEEIEVAAPLETPATYLLPPAPGKHIDYYYRGEEPEQTDWYPIPAKSQEGEKPAEEKNRNGKVLGELPSRSLVPPTANAQNDYIILEPSAELELPNENIDKPTILQEIPKKFHKKAPHIHPKIVPAPYFMPKQKYYPTKLYPKKVVSDFKPIPIPISQYVDGPIDQVPMARPVKPFRPAVNVEGQYVTQDKQIYPQDKQVFSHHDKPVYSPHDKHVYSHEKAENQRKLQSEIDGSEEQKIMANEEYDDAPREQEASETNYGHPGRNAYPAPLKAAPPAAPAQFASPSGERTEFRMHGMKGPHSYQFGYDTGKGKNRQFRYEERDNEGHVKGHYGYVDKFGKLRVVNYDADQHGFRADAPVEKE